MQQASTSERVTRNETIVGRTGDRELTVTRTFNAPAHIVFDAWTKPELLKRWWAPKSFGATLFTCEQDLRVGGAYRDRFRARPRGSGRRSRGAISRSIHPRGWSTPKSMSGCPNAGEAIVTADFEESEGRTRLPLRQLFPSKEALERALASGMERGMRVTLDQLDALVASMC